MTDFAKVFFQRNLRIQPEAKPRKNIPKIDPSKVGVKIFYKPMARKRNRKSRIQPKVFNKICSLLAGIIQQSEQENQERCKGPNRAQLRNCVLQCLTYARKKTLVVNFVVKKQGKCMRYAQILKNVKQIFKRTQRI